MLIARTRADLDAALATLRATHSALGLVPTMGALHAGHLSLLEVARAALPPGAAIAASIFVNPTQFAPHEDFTRYPRQEAADLDMLRAAGCALAWLPGVADMYPPGDVTLIDMAGPALGFEGAIRPTHFRGVATVVAKLIGQTRADLAVFGEKDFQQLQVIRRMVTDLALPVRVLGAPILREDDGLAMSSRNRYLSAAERARAPALYKALCVMRDALHAGVSLAEAQGAAAAQLEAAGMSVDYLALIDGAAMSEIAAPAPGARLLGAARLGAVRLLDNIAAG